MLLLDEFARELWRTAKAAMYEKGQTLPDYNDLPPETREIALIQARMLLDQYYLFRRESADKILEIMAVECGYWKEHRATTGE